MAQSDIKTMLLWLKAVPTTASSLRHCTLAIHTGGLWDDEDARQYQTGHEAYYFLTNYVSRELSQGHQQETMLCCEKGAVKMHFSLNHPRTICQTVP